jgi:hypothetical protein
MLTSRCAPSHEAVFIESRGPQHYAMAVYDPAASLARKAGAY